VYCHSILLYHSTGISAYCHYIRVVLYHSTSISAHCHYIRVVLYHSTSISAYCHYICVVLDYNSRLLHEYTAITDDDAGQYPALSTLDIGKQKGRLQSRLVFDVQQYSISIPAHWVIGTSVFIHSYNSIRNTHPRAVPLGRA